MLYRKNQVELNETARIKPLSFIMDQIVLQKSCNKYSIQISKLAIH
jgi:hypothetical protein